MPFGSVHFALTDHTLSPSPKCKGGAKCCPQCLGGGDREDGMWMESDAWKGFPHFLKGWQGSPVSDATFCLVTGAAPAGAPAPPGLQSRWDKAGGNFLSLTRRKESTLFDCSKLLKSHTEG